jgi:hypothetical protein
VVEVTGQPINSNQQSNEITITFQLVLSSAFLCPTESVVLHTALPGWRLGSPFSTYDTQPLAPIHARRYRGFGKRSAARSAYHTLQSTKLLGHFAWCCLDPASRLALVRAMPIMGPYALLLRHAETHRHQIRKTLRAFIGLQPTRTRDMGAAFLLFDCCYGDFVRWLCGEYTNQDRNWHALSTIYKPADREPTPMGYPITDFHLSYRKLTEGVPLRGPFQCSAADTRARIRYDNHPPARNNQEDVRAKFAAE